MIETMPETDPLQDLRRILAGLARMHTGKHACDRHILKRAHGRDQIEGLKNEADLMTAEPGELR